MLNIVDIIVNVKIIIINLKHLLNKKIVKYYKNMLFFSLKKKTFLLIHKPFYFVHFIQIKMF